MIRIRYDIFYLDRQTIKESNMSKRTIYLTIDELALVLLTGQGLSTRQQFSKLFVDLCFRMCSTLEKNIRWRLIDQKIYFS